jgi:hypothetical protein
MSNTAPFIKQLFLVRMGDRPSPQVTEALMPFVHEGKAIAFPIPGAIVSIFYTEHSIPEIAQAIQERTGAYFMLSENAAFHFPAPVMDMVLAQLQRFGMTSHEVMETQAPQEPTLTLDDLLELVSRGGVSSLTAQQRQLLEELSR